jgi:DNA helicase-2/ATP-dependent DNA helicase PcrA
MTTFTTQQKAVINVRTGKHAVIAGAGAGKTATLVARAQRLSPENTLVVTFTKAAAEEFAERLANARGIEVRTWHSWGYNVLKKAGYATQIADEHAKLTRIRDLFKASGMKESLDPQNLLTAEVLAEKISFAKRQGQLCVTADGRILRGRPEATEFSQREWDLWIEYEKGLSESYTVDFDDLVLKTRNILTVNKVLLTQWQNAYIHLLVDETQDNTTLQWDLVDLLSPTMQSAVVVGDPDQSIYAFAGATPERFKAFATTNGTILHKLPDNFRSCEDIVAKANTLISLNENRIERDMIAHRTDGKVSVTKVTNQSHEIAVAMKAYKLQGISWEEQAVLCRTRRETAEIERLCLQHKIPYTIRRGTSFFELRHIKVPWNYLVMLHQVMNDLPTTAAKAVGNWPTRYLGNAWESLAANYGWKLDNFGGRWEKGTTHLLDSVDALSDVLDCGQLPEKQPFKELLKAILDIRGMDPQHTTLRDTLIGKRVASGESIEKTREAFLADWMFLAALLDSECKTLAEAVTLYETLTGPKDKDAVHGVQIMTMHAAKGTEYDVVHAPNWVEDLFPHAIAVKEHLLEEERRLAFVTLTRARRFVNVYVPTSSTHLKKPCVPSRFTHELNATRK